MAERTVIGLKRLLILSEFAIWAVVVLEVELL